MILVSRLPRTIRQQPYRFKRPVVSAFLSFNEPNRAGVIPQQRRCLHCDDGLRKPAFQVNHQQHPFSLHLSQITFLWWSNLDEN
jgi:hypothetical protein